MKYFLEVNEKQKKGQADVTRVPATSFKFIFFNNRNQFMRFSFDSEDWSVFQVDYGVLPGNLDGHQ